MDTQLIEQELKYLSIFETPMCDVIYTLQSRYPEYASVGIVGSLGTHLCYKFPPTEEDNYGRPIPQSRKDELKDATGEKARAALEKADTYVWLLRYFVDVVIRDYLIGTRLAPYIADEAAGFRPPETGRIPDWLSEHDDHLSAEEKAQIVRLRRQVIEGPLADACALVVQVLSDSLAEGERRMAEYRRTPLAPTREEQKARMYDVLTPFSLFSRYWHNLYHLLFRVRFAYYIEHNPETVAYRREEEALRREHPPQS